MLGQKLWKFFRCFWKIEDTIISFWNFLTFSGDSKDSETDFRAAICKTQSILLLLKTFRSLVLSQMSTSKNLMDFPVISLTFCKLFGIPNLEMRVIIEHSSTKSFKKRSMCIMVKKDEVIGLSDLNYYWVPQQSIFTLQQINYLDSIYLFRNNI